MSKNFILGLISFLLFYFMIPTTSFAYDISDDYSLGYKIGTNLKALSGDHDVQEYWDESQKNQLKNIKKVLVLTTINPNSIDYIGYQNTNLIVENLGYKALLDNKFNVEKASNIQSLIIQTLPNATSEQKQQAMINHIMNSNIDAMLIIDIGAFTRINSSAIVLFNMKLINLKNPSSPIMVERQEYRIANSSRFKVASADGTGQRILNKFIRDIVKETN